MQRTRDSSLRLATEEPLPLVLEAAGPNARFAYEEFLSELAENSLIAYRRALYRFFAHLEDQGLELRDVGPKHVRSYIQGLQATIRTKRGEEPRTKPASKPTKKLHLAAPRHFFDKAVQRHAMLLNPALSVRGPKHSVTTGKTKGLGLRQARKLLKSIDVTTPIGLRDRAIIATLLYTAARRGAVAKLRRKDFHTDGRQHYFEFDEKGGKQRTIPCREDLERYMNAYLEVATPMQPEDPVFRTARGRNQELADGGITGDDVLRMFKRRLKAAGLPTTFSCHSCRKATATNLLEQGVELADVQNFLGHADPRTTKLYDAREMTVTRNLVERIGI